MRPLPYPPGAEQDPDSIEVLRGWVVRGELEVAIAPWVWQNQVDEWGRLLADAAAHMADAVASESGKDRDAVYRVVADSIRHHLDQPSHNREGDFVDGSPE